VYIGCIYEDRNGIQSEEPTAQISWIWGAYEIIDLLPTVQTTWQSIQCHSFFF
jgi:hypothetical protein